MPNDLEYHTPVIIAQRMIGAADSKPKASDTYDYRCGTTTATKSLKIDHKDATIKTFEYLLFYF